MKMMKGIRWIINVMTQYYGLMLSIAIVASGWGNAVFAEQVPMTASQAPAILVLGDSLSAAHGIEIKQGWVHLLQQRLQAKGYPHLVINESVSGDTSGQGLEKFERLLKQHHPRLLILELGGNDGLRGSNLKRLKSNLSAILEQAKQAQLNVLFLGMRIPPNYGIAYSERFQQIYQELAIQYQVAFIPFFLEGVATRRELMLADNIHPNETAQPLLLDTIWQGLEPLLK